MDDFLSTNYDDGFEPHLEDAPKLKYEYRRNVTQQVNNDSKSHTVISVSFGRKF